MRDIGESNVDRLSRNDKNHANVSTPEHLASLESARIELQPKYEKDSMLACAAVVMAIRRIVDPNAASLLADAG